MDESKLPADVELWTCAEADAVLIEDWFIDREGPKPEPPPSSQVGELNYVFQNIDAWVLVDQLKLPYGLTKDEAAALMASYVGTEAV